LEHATLLRLRRSRAEPRAISNGRRPFPGGLPNVIFIGEERQGLNASSEFPFKVGVARPPHLFFLWRVGASQRLPRPGCSFRCERRSTVMKTRPRALMRTKKPGPWPVRCEPTSEDPVQRMVSRQRLNSRGYRIVRYHRVDQGADWKHVSSPLH